MSFGKNLEPSVVGYDAELVGDRWIFNEGLIFFGNSSPKVVFIVVKEEDEVNDSFEAGMESSGVESLSIVSPSGSSVTSPAPAARPSSSPTTPSTPVSRPRTDYTPGIHTDPDWLKKLKANFKAEVIVPCSERVRSAVETDLYIEVVR